jgi:hypothetical protein
LVQLRNPWGNHEWTGDWSDNSPLWTPELKAAANFKNAVNDGIFFMALEDFVKSYSNSQICHVKYNSVVKSYNINGQHMSSPVVFNLILEEDSVIVLDVFTRHWRFNRGTGNNPNQLTSMLLGSYDSSGNLSFINSGCDNEELLDLNLSLKRGNYVLWVYNSYFRLPDPKPEHYIVRFISQSSKVNFQKVGLDTNGNMIRRLMDSAIGDNSTGTTTDSRGVITKRGNKLPNTCIGYARISYSPTTTTAPQSIFINIDTTKNQNITFLPPFNQSPTPTINFSLALNSSFIIVGIQNDMTLSTLFSIGNTSSTTAKGPLSTVDVVAKIDISSLTLTSNKLTEFTSDYTTPTMSTALAIKQFRVKKF